MTISDMYHGHTAALEREKSVWEKDSEETKSVMVQTQTKKIR